MMKETVENLFRFKISNYNFSLPLPPCIRFVFTRGARDFTN